MKGMMPTIKERIDNIDWAWVGEVIGKILTDVITCGIIAFIGHVTFSYPWLIIGAFAMFSIFVRTGLADKFRDWN